MFATETYQDDQNKKRQVIIERLIEKELDEAEAQMIRLHKLLKSLRGISGLLNDSEAWKACIFIQRQNLRVV